MFKLYLDPGHGGSDPGAVANGLQEKHLTLDIALRIRHLLEHEYQDVAIRMSRTTDISKSLKERTDEANAWGADYFLSIHMNALNGSAHGYEDFIHNSSSDTSRTAQYRDIIHQEIAKVNQLFNRGKKKANFHVLRETRMSALLSENGFIDNGSDAQKLRDPVYRQSVARGHVNGLARAFHLKKRRNDMYRVIVDGHQVGTYQVEQNVLNAVQRHLTSARRIVIERV